MAAAPVDAAEVERARYLMGTVCRGTVHAPTEGEGATALAAAFEAIAAAESLLSTWRPGTELTRANAAAWPGPVLLSAPLGEFLAQALALAAETDGAFDPTVGPLVDLYDLRGPGRLPTASEVLTARRRVGHRRVELQRRPDRLRFRTAGMWIDPGAIGKGYALDQAAAVLGERGIRQALLDFGGQVLALGAPPGEDAWTLGVADPDERERVVLTLAVRDVSIATSAQSERGARVEGRWLGHILDPRRGGPVPRRGSVTVVSRRAVEADALATALFVMGPREGLQWIQGRPDLEAGFLEPREAGAAGWRLRSGGSFRGRVRSWREDVIPPADQREWRERR